VPLARYDPQYARALGKWMLNLANAARLFYPGALPPGHETSAFWKGDPQGVIAYEGLRYEWLGKRPCATGDPVALNWGPKTDLGLYGSSYVGMLGALIRPTNEPYILQLDCLATDFFRDRAYPTFLYFNPHSEPRNVVLPLDERPVCVYDAVAKKFVVERAQRTVCVSVPADGAALLVVAPADGVVRREGRKLLIDDVVIDYHAAVEGDR
jgi:hypothetical protein